MSGSLHATTKGVSMKLIACGGVMFRKGGGLSLITDPEQLPREAIWTAPAWRTGGKQRRGKPSSATRDRRPSIWGVQAELAMCARAGEVVGGCESGGKSVAGLREIIWPYQDPVGNRSVSGSPQLMSLARQGTGIGASSSSRASLAQIRCYMQVL